MSSKPVKNFDEILAHPQYATSSRVQSHRNESSSYNFNPFIYGNDIDSVDLATRVAMVRVVSPVNQCRQTVYFILWYVIIDKLL